MEQVTEPLIFKHLREEVPNPKQILFFKSNKKHIAYGGARGGGKSWAMRRKFVMLAMRYPELRLLLLRRSYPELRENHILPLMSELKGYANWKEQEKVFVFPNGSRLKLGFCDNERDMMQYQGQEYDVIGFEEATNFEEKWIRFISSTLRTTRTDFVPRIYYTCNPGGPSHAYIKRLFIDKQYIEKERPEDYDFIQALVTDNKVLMEKNPDYIHTLENLPAAQRKGHLYGDWDVYEGQVFEEFRNIPEHYADGIGTHVIEPFDVPPDWNIYRSFDWGYSKPFSVGWWAVDYDGRLYRILELYGCVPGEPDTGVKWTANKVFDEISNIERDHKWLKGKQISGVADPAIWQKGTGSGKSLAETAENYGIYFEHGNNARLAGWDQVHYRLQFDESGIPMMYVFKNCKNFIRTLPTLCYSDIKPEDVNTKQEDHIADETRYMCMTQPIKPVKVKTKTVLLDDPLNMNESTAYNPYRAMIIL